MVPGRWQELAQEALKKGIEWLAMGVSMIFAPLRPVAEALVQPEDVN